MISYKEAMEVFEYNCDTGDIFWKVCPGNQIAAGSIAGAVNGRGYRHIVYKRKQYLSHRLAWLLHHGTWPADEIDHINHSTCDNRICNLREVSHRENSLNQTAPSNNKSGTPGVHWHKGLGKWTAAISVHGQQQYLGSFDSLGSAIYARKFAEKKHGYHINHGEIIE